MEQKTSCRRVSLGAKQYYLGAFNCQGLENKAA